MNESARELSRRGYNVSVGEDRTIAPELINTGSLQRIADACELMAKNRELLQRDRDWYQRSWKERGEEIAALKRSNAALRGVITKQRMAMEDLVEKYNCIVMQRGQEREETT